MNCSAGNNLQKGFPQKLKRRELAFELCCPELPNWLLDRVLQVVYAEIIKF